MPLIVFYNMAADASKTQLRPIALRLVRGCPFVSYVHIKAVDQAVAAGAGGLAETPLFVAGLPCGVGEAVLLKAFSCFGPVARVVVHATKVRAAWALHKQRCMESLTGGDGDGAGVRATVSFVCAFVCIPADHPNRCALWWWRLVSIHVASCTALTVCMQPCTMCACAGFIACLGLCALSCIRTWLCSFLDGFLQGGGGQGC